MRKDKCGEIQPPKPSGYQVDDPSKRPELAFDMAEQSYDILVEAVPICLQKNPQRNVIIKTYDPIRWTDISQEVSDFCQEANADRRKNKADQLGARVVQYQFKMKER